MRSTGAVNFTVPTETENYFTNLTDFRGLDLSYNPLKTNETSARDILNLYVDDEAVLTTRPRLLLKETTTPPEGYPDLIQISRDGERELFQFGNETESVLVYNDVVVKLDGAPFVIDLFPVQLFEHQDSVYVLADGDVWVLSDDSSVSPISKNAYVPTTIVGSEGGTIGTGVAGQERNRFTGRYRESYAFKPGETDIKPPAGAIDVQNDYYSNRKLTTNAQCSYVCQNGDLWWVEDDKLYSFRDNRISEFDIPEGKTYEYQSDTVNVIPKNICTIVASEDGQYIYFAVKQENIARFGYFITRDDTEFINIPNGIVYDETFDSEHFLLTTMAFYKSPSDSSDQIRVAFFNSVYDATYTRIPRFYIWRLTGASGWVLGSPLMIRTLPNSERHLSTGSFPSDLGLWIDRLPGLGAPYSTSAGVDYSRAKMVCTSNGSCFFFTSGHTWKSIATKNGIACILAGSMEYGSGTGQTLYRIPLPIITFYNENPFFCFRNICVSGQTVTASMYRKPEELYKIYRMNNLVTDFTNNVYPSFTLTRAVIVTLVDSTVSATQNTDADTAVTGTIPPDTNFSGILKIQNDAAYVFGDTIHYKLNAPTDSYESFFEETYDLGIDLPMVGKNARLSATSPYTVAYEGDGEVGLLSYSRESEILLFYTFESIGETEYPESIRRVIEFGNVFWYFGEHDTIYYSFPGDPTYLPTTNYNVFGNNDKITGVSIISDDVMAVYKADETWLIKATGDATVPFIASKLKTELGNDPFGQSIVTLYSNIPVVIHKSGIYGLFQAKDIPTEDRVFTSLSDKINAKYLKEAYRSDIKTHNHRFLTFFYFSDKPNHTKMYVMDNRTQEWFYWEFPVQIIGMYETMSSDEEPIPVAFSKNAIYELVTYGSPSITAHSLFGEYTNYLDRISSTKYKPVEWCWESQRLPLKTLNYSKKLRTTTLIMVDTDASDIYSLDYAFKPFRKRGVSITEERTAISNINYLKNAVLRTKIPRFDYLSIVLSSPEYNSDVKTITDYVDYPYNTQLRLVGIVLKYNLMEASRT